MMCIRYDNTRKYVCTIVCLHCFVVNKLKISPVTNHAV